MAASVERAGVDFDIICLRLHPRALDVVWWAGASLFFSCRDMMRKIYLFYLNPINNYQQSRRASTQWIGVNWCCRRIRNIIARPIGFCGRSLYWLRLQDHANSSVVWSHHIITSSWGYGVVGRSWWLVLIDDWRTLSWRFDNLRCLKEIEWTWGLMHRLLGEGEWYSCVSLFFLIRISSLFGDNEHYAHPRDKYNMNWNNTINIKQWIIHDNYWL